ncbi:hypothetical protein P7K49_015247, partial [Saguinus oedipus]
MTTDHLAAAAAPFRPLFPPLQPLITALADDLRHHRRHEGLSTLREPPVLLPYSQPLRVARLLCTCDFHL